jgi:hypothetical protein
MNKNLVTICPILMGFEELYKNTTYFKDIRKCIEYFPNANWDVALGRSQILSKVWLRQNLIPLLPQKNEVKTLICGGWYGVLARLLFEEIDTPKMIIRTCDIDKSCVEIAEQLNTHWLINKWQFKSFTSDIHNIDYENFSFNVETESEVIEISENIDVIINTSCEHIHNFNSWYDKLPIKKLIALQSTDLEDKEHINNVLSLNEFKAMAPMRYSFSGEIPIKSGENKRFMLIGHKE